MRFLITGAAGFIGFHLARRLLDEGHTVLGLDAFTPYYDQNLKRRRFELLSEFSNFKGRELWLEDATKLETCVQEASADVVLHLAAQAGVRYSAENPRSYIDSNIIGTFNLLEALARRPCGHLLLASTSSVYGSGKQPFTEGQPTDQPLSLYAATKIATEALAFNRALHSQLPTTTVRLFTVFGPWGRPDMALFKFTKSILEGSPIDVYGFGKMRRDFTYVADVVEAICRLAERPPTEESVTATGSDFEAPYRVVNIGRGQPIELKRFISAIEAETGHNALQREMPMQPGEMASTWADVTRLTQLTGYRPTTPLTHGIRDFVAWYRDYYNV